MHGTSMTGAPIEEVVGDLDRPGLVQRLLAVAAARVHQRGSASTSVCSSSNQPSLAATFGVSVAPRVSRYRAVRSSALSSTV